MNHFSKKITETVVVRLKNEPMMGFYYKIFKNLLQPEGDWVKKRNKRRKFASATR
jgi:hypothetical protein